MKTRHLLRVAALLGVAAIPLSIKAQEPTRVMKVQELYQWCKSSDDSNKIACKSLIIGAAGQIGFINTIAFMARDPSDRELLYAFGACGGPSTAAAGVQAFTNWAEKHPERWADEFSAGINVALHEAWPCDNLPK